jgi:ribosomal protein L19E
MCLYCTFGKKRGDGHHKGKKNANVLLSIYILHIRVSNVLRYILKLFQSECKIACHVCEECLNFARQPHHFINNCH